MLEEVGQYQKLHTCLTPILQAFHFPNHKPKINLGLGFTNYCSNVAKKENRATGSDNIFCAARPNL
jgi:hypothetical protein